MNKRPAISFWPGNPLSYTTTLIKCYFNEIYLGPATGFVLKVGSNYGLATNWHVVSGRNAATNACLSSMAALPNRIECHVAVDRKIRRKDGRPSNELFFKPLNIDLYDSDDAPIWLDTRNGENQDDVAVIPLNARVEELSKRNYSVRAIEGGKVAIKRNAPPITKTSNIPVDAITHVYPGVGAEVFIIGYPRGIASNGIFPIWKRGSIASEPQVGVTLSGVDHETLFYIDALTKAGMSGSPVVFVGSGDDAMFTDDGGAVVKRDAEPYLVGVYAGRDGVTQEEYELSLGRVWKVALVESLFLKNPTRWP